MQATEGGGSTECEGRDQPGRGMPCFLGLTRFSGHCGYNKVLKKTKEIGKEAAFKHQKNTDADFCRGVSNQQLLPCFLQHP